MYDTIILGATFAAAGIAQECKGSCLVIEQHAQAGWEFTGALLPSSNESVLYHCFEKCDILFCTRVVSLENTGTGFSCTTHGINGFRIHAAKHVIDTRCSDAMCQSKTYNLLIESAEIPDNLQTAYTTQKRVNTYLLHCAVPRSCGYGQARQIAANIIRKFSGTQRLILSANGFDYQVKAGYPKKERGILYFPSNAFDSPTLAFHAGVRIGKEANQ